MCTRATWREHWPAAQAQDLPIRTWPGRLGFNSARLECQAGIELHGCNASLIQLFLGHHRAAQVGAAQLGAAQVGVAQVGVSQVDAVQVGVAQVGVS